jgi:hypothetical protein
VGEFAWADLREIFRSYRGHRGFLGFRRRLTLDCTISNSAFVIYWRTVLECRIVYN